MKLIQSFNYNDMPAYLVDDFLAENEASNDSYVRWYPNYYENEGYRKEINDWLLKDGMINDETTNFYVLINVSW